MAGRYVIEPIQEAHIQGVCELEKLTNQAPWSESSFLAELRNPQACYFVAVADGRVVGFGGYWAIVDEAHVTTLAVHPEHRRMGLGRDLMAALLGRAKKQGIRCSTLEVRAGNMAAIALYERLGYIRCALRKGYYPNNREDAVVMWLYGLDERTWTT